MARSNEPQELFRETKLFVTKISGVIHFFEEALNEITERTPDSQIEENMEKYTKHFEEARTTLDESKTYTESFLKIASNQSSYSATVFFKIKNGMGKVEKKRLSLLYLLNKFLTLVLKCLTNQDFSKRKNTVHNLLTLIDNYNQMLASDPTLAPTTYPAHSSTVQSVLHKNKNYLCHIHENTCSPLNYKLKAITTSKILGIIARQRARTTSAVMAKSLIQDTDRQQLEFMTTDTQWMVQPNPYQGIQAELTGRAYIKTAEGDSKQEKKEGEETKPPVFQADMRSHFGVIERLVEDESVLLHHILSIVPKVAGLVNSGMLKEGSDGTPKLNGTMRKKMGEYFHDVLWRTTGQIIEESLLWNAYDGVPLGLVHPIVPLVMSNLLKEHVQAKLGDSYPVLVLPALHITIETLNLHALSAAWDVQIIRCQAYGSRQKTQRLILDDGSHSSVTGKLFNDTVNILVHLNNRCLPDVLNDIVIHGSHDPEEYSFLEEIHILRRLHATYFACRNWVESKSAINIQSWKVADFFIINHGDLRRMVPFFDLLQICDHKNVSGSNSTSIKLFCHIQSSLSKNVTTCQTKIRNLPSEQNENMSRVCRTFCLACLQNNFPNGRHWGKSSSNSSGPGSYVKEYIDRILLPVFTSLTIFPTEVQQVVGRLAIKTLCDSWLEHIYQKKFKFSECGASQLAKDFAFLRQWIEGSQQLTEDSKRYLLLLDSIRQCEGVACLLQNSYGKDVSVKPARGNNKVAPGEVPVEDASPVAEVLEAIPPELYVTNHKQWLSLRVGGGGGGGGGMGMPFCC